MLHAHLIRSEHLDDIQMINMCIMAKPELSQINVCTSEIPFSNELGIIVKG